MTTTDNPGEKPAAPARRRRTTATTESAPADAAKPSSGQEAKAGASASKPSPKVSDALEPHDTYRSVRRVWPD